MCNLSHKQLLYFSSNRKVVNNWLYVIQYLQSYVLIICRGQTGHILTGRAKKLYFEPLDELTKKNSEDVAHDDIKVTSSELVAQYVGDHS